MIDRISLAYWLPKLMKSGIPVPKTEWWETDTDFWPVLDGKSSKEANEFLNDLKSRANKWGYPLFLRTGHTSAKHSWKRSCYVTKEEDLGRAVFELLEYSGMAMPSMPWDVWAIREFLDLDIRFYAFWGDMPISVERRYFIEPRRVICHHPYWPSEAFENTNMSADNWRELLEEMNSDFSDHEKKLLSFYCDQVLVKGEFEGRWSLDFARDMNKNWYAIDMAPMEVSYHWPGCKEK